MRTSTRFQVITALLLLAACAAVALLGMPRKLVAANDDLVKQNTITQEVASKVAIAIDTGTIEELSASIEALLAQYPELIAVEIAPAHDDRSFGYGSLDSLHSHESSSLSRINKVALVRGGQPWGEVRVLIASKPLALPTDGQFSWVIITIAVVVLPLAVVAIEITRRRLDRSPGGPMAVAAARAQHTLDTLAEGVLLLDSNGHIVFSNQAFSDAAGMTPASIAGRPVADLSWIAPPDSTGQDYRPWISVLSTGQPIRGIRVGLEHNGTTVLFIANCTPLFRKPGSLHGVLVTLDDVTELEQGRLAIRDARDAAQHANEAKSRFLAMMSHEIRTPLNGVCGTLQLLRKTPLERNQSQYIEAASFSASTLLHLINDVLDLSKIEAGQLELSPIDFEFEECVDRTMLMMAQPARAKGIAVAYDIDSAVGTQFTADPDRIRQIIINLVNNAIKFTERGAVTLKVSVDRDSPTHQLLKCDVKDTGIGIPENKLGRLFKAFSQVDSSTSRKYGGTGLGLVISKQLCEAMGGQITVSSTVGVGTTFTFTLDLVKATASLAAAPAQPAKQTPLAILIGLHDLEVCRVQTALGLSRDSLIALDDISALARVADKGELPQDHADVLVLVARSEGDNAELTKQAIRAALPDGSVRIIFAVHGNNTGAPSDATPPDDLIQRPIGSSRLLRALDAKATQLSGPKPTTAPTATNLQGIRVLLAEDNPVGQMVVSDMLRGFGAHCDAVADGNAVLAALSGQSYDLVLMDCFMPELDGFETTRRIRALQKDAKLPERLPIVALTAKAMRGDREACLDAGMDGYITKPVDQDELLRVVSQHSNRSSTSQAIPQPPPAPSAVNTAALQQRYAGKPALLKQLTDAFRSVAAQDLAHISNAIAARDAHQLEHAAHRLAGGAGFVSADEVRRLATKLERLSSQQQFEEVQAIADQLRREVSDALAALDEALGKAQRLKSDAAESHKETSS